MHDERSDVCRGLDRSKMAGLQKRIATLFLQLLENPQFNPAAKRLQPGKGLSRVQTQPLA